MRNLWLPMNAYSYENKVLSGITAKSIDVACNMFEKKLNVNWENYITTVIETDMFVIVTFSAKDKPKGFRGSPPGIPGFEIKIQKSNYEIIESHFVR